MARWLQLARFTPSGIVRRSKVFWDLAPFTLSLYRGICFSSFLKLSCLSLVPRHYQVEILQLKRD